MSISEVSRRNILDWLTVGKVCWHGRLDEEEFLSRLYNLRELPSNDHRFPNALRDIWQHCTMNRDWPDEWVFTDRRFDLLYGPDDVFLRFLCEMLHPIVRPDQQEVNELLTAFNSHLKPDGWEIVEKTRISNAPVFAARSLLSGPGPQLDSAKEAIGIVLDCDYVTQQITRMEAAAESDPELAIGTAKELVETVCKTILDNHMVMYNQNEDVPKLVRMTLRELGLAPENIPERAKASHSIRVLLSNLASVADRLAELRNAYGTGHGKAAGSKGLRPRHAKLAVGAAITLAVFLFETHREQSESQQV